MSFARSIAARRAPFLSSGIAQRAAFSQSIVRCAGKESKLHTEGRSDEAEALKQDQLQKQKQGKQHWEEGLASDSESIVKAEKGESGSATSGETIKKLQEETAKASKKGL